jgi:hypothetical protein
LVNVFLCLALSCSHDTDKIYINTAWCDLCFGLIYFYHLADRSA